MSYQQRLNDATAARGRLCVGIDPMPSVLDAWRQPVTVQGLESCARGIVETLADHVAVFKPQSAFFEPFGAAGIAVLERVLIDIRDAGAISILDVKRGDIGSSMRGYTEAYLGDGPLSADAITVNPFLGPKSLHDTYRFAAAQARGIYVLARTSNPESSAVQEAQREGKSISQLIIDDVSRLNRECDNAIGLVIGATHKDLNLDLTHFAGSVLAPGIGAQGATVADLVSSLPNAFDKVLPTASRSVIGYGQGELVSRVMDLLNQLEENWDERP